MAFRFSHQTAARRAISALNRAARMEYLSKICHLWMPFRLWERCTGVAARPAVCFTSAVGKHDTRKLATNFSLECCRLTTTNCVWLCLSLGKYRSSLPSTPRSSSGLFPPIFSHQKTCTHCSSSPCLQHAHPISTTLT